ncbi:hypothetical protein ACQP00_20935 [Dactylosporangium sp. CS-047395]|uniref:hypothetical protein n=1 Tax=Dactylosporangium sp. CS-047395 TaxID=3239936 RepID=UPI003D8EB02A
MTHTLVVTAVVVVAYGTAGAAVLTLFRAVDTAGARAAVSARRAARRSPVVGEWLAHAEIETARSLIVGRIDPVAYHRAMAMLAALDAVTNPLTAPDPPR